MIGIKTKEREHLNCKPYDFSCKLYIFVINSTMKYVKFITIIVNFILTMINLTNIIVNFTFANIMVIIMIIRFSILIINFIRHFDKTYDQLV